MVENELFQSPYVASLFLYLAISVHTKTFIQIVSSFLAVILLHAAMRKRNIKNKFANTVELFKEDVTPMTILLSKICSAEEQQR